MERLVGLLQSQTQLVVKRYLGKLVRALCQVACLLGHRGRAGDNKGLLDADDGVPVAAVSSGLWRVLYCVQRHLGVQRLASLQQADLESRTVTVKPNQLSFAILA